MASACTPFERSNIFDKMREQSPPDGYLGALSCARPRIDHSGWIKLTRSLKVAQAPGLVKMV